MRMEVRASARVQMDMDMDNESNDQNSSVRNASGRNSSGRNASGRNTTGGRGSCRATSTGRNTTGERNTTGASNNSRRHPIHGVLSNPNRPAIVYLTVCTKDRMPWLADPSVHDLLLDVWRQADLWLVGRYVIMPDHLHLFAGERGDIELENWVQYWKSQFTKRHGLKDHRWQTDHWDRRIRTEFEYEETWNYIYLNPVRAKLVVDAEAWPYAGTVNNLPWD